MGNILNRKDLSSGHYQQNNSSSTNCHQSFSKLPLLFNEFNFDALQTTKASAMSTKKHMLRHGIALPESQEQQSEAISFQSAYHMQLLEQYCRRKCLPLYAHPAINFQHLNDQTDK
ncbi:MAG: hypothetical protein ACLSTW_02235 [Faecalibacterium sp.]